MQGTGRNGDAMRRTGRDVPSERRHPGRFARLAARLLAGICCCLVGSAAWAQVIIIPPHPPYPPRPPIPIPRPLPRPRPPQYEVRRIDVHASVRDQVARVQVEQVFRNTDHRVVETQFLFPLPPGAAITGLTLLVDGREVPGKLLKKDEARRIYEEIVRKHRDPALLEYVGRDLYQTSVFPVPPGKERRVELRYTHLLPAQDGLIDFVLPVGTAKHCGRPVKELRLELRIETSRPLKTVYSPSHDLDVKRPDDHHAVATVTLRDVAAPDDVRVLFGVRDGLVGANLVSYRPERDQDGYFMLLLAPDIQHADSVPVAKTIVFVIDRSGSMSGTKIQQAREALKFVLQRLQRHDENHPGDLFNIVAYDSEIESFRPELQRADDKTIAEALAFADGIHAGGSTNIDAALKTAFGMLHDSSRPNYVVFLTDGLPTVGEQNELRITENSRDANRVKARLFAFGVGFDVNSRLLDRLARTHRGSSIYVRPNENIEEHVARLYNRIAAPVMTDLALKFEFDQRAAVEPPAVNRVYPRTLPDLFRGEQLVVVGRYRKAGAARAVLTGRIADKPQRFTFPVRFEEHSRDDRNSFVETLWAIRRIGDIIDELDLHGHNQELIDELVQLSLKHGIVTPYTSFLANEDAVATDRSELRRRAATAARRELAKTSGASAFAQRAIKGSLQIASSLGGAADALAPGTALSPSEQAELKPFIAAAQAARRAIRRIAAKTFYRVKGEWRDANVTPEELGRAKVVKQFSDEYFELAAKFGGRFAKYLTFEEPVVVKLEGRVYRIEP